MAYTPTTGSDDPTVYTHLNGLEVHNNLIVDGNLTVKGIINNAEAATALNTVGNGTVTAAMITSQNVIRGGAQSGTAFTDTTDTAALIVAAIAQAVAGDGFVFTYVNNTNAIATLVGGSGVNSGGTIAVIPPGSQIEFLVVLTSLSAVTFTVLGDGSATAFQPNKTVALTTAGAGTITGAGIASGVTLRSGSTSAFTDTTDTAANIIAARAQVFIGSSWEYTYKNNTVAAVATLTGGSGVTVSGFTVIPSNAGVKYLVTYTAASTITMVGIEAFSMAADATDATKVVGFKPSGQTTGKTALIATVNTNDATYTLPVATDTLAGLGTAQTFTAAQTFTNSDLILLGSSTGANTFAAANSSATNYTTTVPAVTGTLASTSGTNLFLPDVKKCSAQKDSITTALADVTGLTAQTLVASATYRFRCVLPGTADGTSGIKYAFTYTTATLTSVEATGIGYTASAVAVQHTTTTTNSTLLFDQAAAVIMVVLEGTAVINAGGTVALQIGTHTGTTTCSCYLGATMEWVRIA